MRLSASKVTSSMFLANPSYACSSINQPCQNVWMGSETWIRGVQLPLISEPAHPHFPVVNSWIDGRDRIRFDATLAQPFKLALSCTKYEGRVHNHGPCQAISYSAHHLALPPLKIVIFFNNYIIFEKN